MALKGSRTEKDILDGFLECASNMQLDLKQLVSVTTDGAPAVVGSKNGSVSLLEKHVKEMGNKHIILKFHCIIHQEALCAKSTGFVDAMKVVVRAVNFILYRALNHWHFQDLLAEINSQYNDLLDFCEVRWLSREKNVRKSFQPQRRDCNLLRRKNAWRPRISKC